MSLRIGDGVLCLREHGDPPAVRNMWRTAGTGVIAARQGISDA